MKKVYIEVQVKNQVQQTIRDTFAGVNQSIHPIPFRYPVTQLRLPAEARAGDFNIFLTQNKGKGPPGRTRSPGKARGHPPEGWEDIPENNAGPPRGVPLSLRRGGPGVSSLPNPIVCQNQIISYKKQNLIFYKHLIFIIMKKQILFLALFTLALIFAGTNNVFGQVDPAQPYQNVLTTVPASCLTPQTMTGCTADALHPVQGALYTYTVTTTTAATDVVRWFVVNSNDIVAPDSLITAAGGILPVGNANIDPTDGTGDYILSLGGTGTYNSGVANNGSIELSWKYFDGITDQVILVAYVEGGDGCTNNIAVYRIIPQPAFTIDIASIMEDGTNPQGPGSATPNTECVSPIQSAFYSGGGTTPLGTLTVDYGENWAFFVVNGANYIDSWMPEFQISYAGGTAPVLSASWAYMADAATPAATWNTLTSAASWTSAVPVIAGGSGNAAGDGVVPAAGGECIVVRVRLDWGTTIEHDLTPGTLTFAANGIAYDGVGTGVSDWYNDTAFEDLHHADCTADGFTNDVVDYTITPRPQVENAVAAPVDIEDKSGEGVN